MAEQDFGADTGDLDAGADEQTDLGTSGQPDGQETGSPQDVLSDGQDVDPNDEQFKHWQGVYTRTRQRDRQRYGKIEQEHQQYGEVLRNFYQSDEYALQVLRQRFPDLASRLTRDGTPVLRETGTRTERAEGDPGLVSMLQQHLGEDLAFLAPRLAPALEGVIAQAVRGAMQPIEARSKEQEEAVRQREAQSRREQEDALLSQMDTEHPGWEQRFGSDMQDLDNFLNSEALTHPRWGNKYQLLLQLVNPDLPRIDATRRMADAGRSRLTTGRSGRPSQSNTQELIMKARNNSEAFRIAAEQAAQELRRGA